MKRSNIKPPTPYRLTRTKEGFFVVQNVTKGALEWQVFSLYNEAVEALKAKQKYYLKKM